MMAKLFFSTKKHEDLVDEAKQAIKVTFGKRLTAFTENTVDYFFSNVIYSLNQNTLKKQLCILHFCQTNVNSHLYHSI